MLGTSLASQGERASWLGAEEFGNIFGLLLDNYVILGGAMFALCIPRLGPIGTSESACSSTTSGCLLLVWRQASEGAGLLMARFIGLAEI